jgi:hypothetical protein
MSRRRTRSRPPPTPPRCAMIICAVWWLESSCRWAWHAPYVAGGLSVLLPPATYLFWGVDSQPRSVCCFHASCCCWLVLILVVGTWLVRSMCLRAGLRRLW